VSNRHRSRELYRRACEVMPAGVNSPVRAFRSVGGDPLFYDHGVGCHIFDADGSRFIDYIGSWGPLILGHAHPDVVEAVATTAAAGLSFGAPCRQEVELAELVTSAVPHLEMVRFVSSGTEAVMSAVRLARGATGRDTVIKFSGCYHGHADHLLVSAGSGLATFGTPSSAGVPESFAAHTRPEYMRLVREQCTRYGALLILDEVITGFRLGANGSAGHYGIEPDLATYGKVIGGGMPVGAYGGRRELMEQLAPLGPVYQAGTLSGNPVAMAAGAATLHLLLADGGAAYGELDRLGMQLQDGLQEVLSRLGIEWSVVRAGSILWLALQEGEPPLRFEDIRPESAETYAALHGALLERGVSLAPSAYEVMFVSLAHDSDIIEETIGAFEAAVREIS